MLPEFKTFTASDLGVNQSTSAITISCPVKWYDGSTSFTKVSGSILIDSNGEFSEPSSPLMFRSLQEHSQQAFQLLDLINPML